MSTNYFPVNAKVLFPLVCLCKPTDSDFDENPHVAIVDIACISESKKDKPEKINAIIHATDNVI